MFCPICGKESKGICKECYLKRNPTGIKNFKLTICKKCGKIFPEIGEEEENLKRIVLKNIFHGEMVKINDLKIDYSKDEKSEKFMNMKVVLFCEYRDEKFENEQDIIVKVINTPCKTCSRKSGHYCEVVLQLRGDREKIKETFNKIAQNFVSDVDELKEGLDVYLISRDYGTSSTKQFADDGAELKFTSKLWGMKDGQRIYRGYILVRFSDIKVNDMVKYRDKIYKVLKTGKFLIGENEAGKKKQFRMKNCEKI
ncbi:MAG: hypothetical protein CVT88_05300 [Candidatus Altiarchaeales archaeon HGW-Altiarchaeales-1]|nr:MAG: hypothetical protein CVT88_05300 [Candidatus Altiarchaeales archaeon HGW-Altiarchaeales-1]